MEPVKLSIRSTLLEEVITKGSDGALNFRTYLAGKWVWKDENIVVRSPIDSSVIARVPRLSWSDVEPVLDKMHKRGRWAVRDTPGSKRLRILSRIADFMEDVKEDFVEVLMLNAGKTKRQAEGEVRACIDRLRMAVMDTRRLVGDYIPGDWSSHTLESEAIIRREPYGIVLTVIPFNYPLFDTINKFVYSVVAGNAVIIKPPSADPLPSIIFARVAEAAGFPKEGLAVVTMPGRESGNLVADPRIGVISLTGSTETGLKVLRQAGIKQYVMELGGGDPAIVLNDADPEVTAEKIVAGIVGYSGQRCDAIKLVLAEKGIYEALKARIVEKLSKIKVGDPRKEDTVMGPLIDPRTIDEMLEAVKEATDKGCKLLYGGKRLGPTYVEPTLLEAPSKEVLRELTLYKEEIFAPVAIMMKVSNIDEAIELANGRRYGLDAAIFGKDISKIRRLIRYLEVGAIYINEYPRHGIGYYPFGGRKDSGIGREGIGYSVEYVTAYKSIVYNYKGEGIWDYM